MGLRGDVSPARPPAFQNGAAAINHCQGGVLEWTAEVCSLEVLMLTHLPPQPYIMRVLLSAYTSTHLEEWPKCSVLVRAGLGRAGPVLHCRPCRGRRVTNSNKEQLPHLLVLGPAFKCQHLPRRRRRLHPRRIH